MSCVRVSVCECICVWGVVCVCIKNSPLNMPHAIGHILMVAILCLKIHQLTPARPEALLPIHTLLHHHHHHKLFQMRLIILPILSNSYVQLYMKTLFSCSSAWLVNVGCRQSREWIQVLCEGHCPHWWVSHQDTPTRCYWRVLPFSQTSPRGILWHIINISLNAKEKIQEDISCFYSSVLHQKCPNSSCSSWVHMNTW